MGSGHTLLPVLVSTCGSGGAVEILLPLDLLAAALLLSRVLLLLHDGGGDGGLGCLGKG